ncbi:FAD-dependent oxidoreductase [Chroococcidiopsis thermalis]|uniref:FAD-dependent pyridine nucleotide-disulfide oxidoreductase n=1 Tax=Chroococcidiopsis thermalis (strain PCC 7203) TaxID=251229 RepID=K9TX66_CHRTP|nr:FAD-dependent oxidoreductase [Chroococcidiopsis thermalis]AFY87417.1 FAD-dependent pyridine nucleotide-disulfide oxidoreductase [Chroococcidiopsis thermalis PCC 7203]
MNSQFHTDVLVVGGGTGGTAAAIQAARSGAKTMLVSEFPWLGGMLTSAGVSVPDGNELEAWQTGLWGAFLRELQQCQPEGLDHSWVSFFSFDPRIGAQIFARWVQELPNLNWLVGQVPQAVLRQGDRIFGVEFAEFTVTAEITIDATELGDLLALAEIPYRWGWEWRSQWGEPSAPIAPNELTTKYPVQAPTWVGLMQDFGDAIAPVILPPPSYNPEIFAGAWESYGAEQFLDYGRLPGNLFMLNWPICGNDYGEGLDRLVTSTTARSEFLQESLWHTQGFLHYIQTQLGRRYGLAEGVFPSYGNRVGAYSRAPLHHSGAYALHPYYRESRRVVGMATVREQDILPLAEGRVAALPVASTDKVNAIAIGNYANDHHYPGFDFPLRSKSIRWGGRWTGTPFTIPYHCLIPAAIDGFLACEQNISVSHIANGATRLQPVVMNLGQAAGMAAAMCISRGCQPRELPVRDVQEALLQEPRCPAAIVPLFNSSPASPDWLEWQRYYLDRPEEYPASGNHWGKKGQGDKGATTNDLLPITHYSGTFHRRDVQDYTLTISTPEELQGHDWTLVTLRSPIDEKLQIYPDNQPISVYGRLNHAGRWLLVEEIEPTVNH